MELKDVILSTLAEMEDNSPVEETPKVQKTTENLQTKKKDIVLEDEPESVIESELTYLNSIRERLLVLFEGFQAPNNSNIEAKVDMTLNFLEYTLATIDERVAKLERGNI